MTTIRNQDCKGYIPESYEQFVQTNTICTDNNSLIRLNYGDHGTALVSSRTNHVVAIASVIFYRPAGAEPYPDIYIQVSPYLNWIDRVQRNFV